MPNYPNYGGINFGPYNNQMNSGFYNGYMQPQQQAMQRPSDGRTYVNGRAGADAYPIPAGVNEIILWDTEAKRYYVKGYDNNGMPRVLEDNDYAPHVEPERQSQPQVDLSQYATKEDIKNMISNAFGMSTFITQQEFNKALSELSVGNGGRIVRTNESNG